MMHLSVKDSGALAILTLRGDISENNIDELRAHLALALDRVNRLIVNCEQVASMDMKCIKQLCTAYRVSRMLKKDFSLAGDPKDLFRSVEESTALAYCMGVGFECGMRCLWENGEAGHPPGAKTSSSLTGRMESLLHKKKASDTII
jgi:anti-anti-sigma regulatory factor